MQQQQSNRSAKIAAEGQAVVAATRNHKPDAVRVYLPPDWCNSHKRGQVVWKQKETSVVRKHARGQIEIKLSATTGILLKEKSMQEKDYTLNQIDLTFYYWLYWLYADKPASCNVQRKIHLHSALRGVAHLYYQINGASKNAAVRKRNAKRIFKRIHSTKKFGMLEN